MGVFSAAIVAGPRALGPTYGHSSPGGTIHGAKRQPGPGGPARPVHRARETGHAAAATDDSTATT